MSHSSDGRGVTALLPKKLRTSHWGVDKEGKSAINLSNLGKFAKFGPGPFIYVRPVGGPKDYLR